MRGAGRSAEIVIPNPLGVEGAVMLALLKSKSVSRSNFRHRSSVAASLVEGAKILEMDRQNRRNGGPRAKAPLWWEFFGFKLIQVLVDPEDQSIFGAVYELKFSSQSGKPPKQVIAFRGTLIRPESWSQDIKLDRYIVQNTLHNSHRVHDGLQAVQVAVSKVGAKDVWLAGYSLGSAIALLVGRNMVLKMGHHLETYLFNPPFVSLPVHIIKNEKLRHGLRLAHTVIKAGMAVAMSTVVQNKKIAEDDEAFTLLFPWIPYLFINPSDPICAEYLDYFKDRETTVAAGAGEIGRFAARNSVRSMIMSASGKDSEPSHLIPSAHLTINLNHSPDLMAAHKLSQWWRPDLELDYKLYQFR
ncbi:PREDICTED: GDSL esterase/lipase At4g10955-like [Ipomoea nil]|uniref:GDSL esterase/lipase At4g10955-like n=1 Tax=Ipomoea nil TaxID=35883 RepID=UPI00090092ED|nr:PREDICTED: GDSL esterase/lipase At4g10955-like [Ipomoea nil]